jgi:hypothetical protein
MTRLLICLFAIIYSDSLSAQDNIPDDFSTVPPVTIADFSPVSPLVNAETDAVVLVDSGATTLDASLQDGFFIKYYQFNRTLLLKKSAQDALGKVALAFSKSMNGRRLKNLRVFTYNLEKGKIYRTEVPDNEIFVEESKSDIKIVKFSFPDLKPGSIIEYDYSERWDSEDLVDWYFQGNYPKLKSVYTVSLPDMFNFSIQFRNKRYLTETQKSTTIKTVYSSNYEYLNSTISSISWTFEDVPAMKEESYTSTISNFLACVKFQLSARPLHPGLSEAVLRDWQQVCNNILNQDQFGDPSSFIKKQANQFAVGKTTDRQKAEAIFAGVRDHFKVTDREIMIPGDQSLNDVYKSAVANVGAINSVLIAMLKSQKIHADPVILATRDKGLTNQVYPLLNNYNYLICRVELDGKIYFLDASDQTMGFGWIPLDCYNGHARVVSTNNFPVFLAADSLKESRTIKVDIRNDANTKSMIMECKNFAGYYESSDIRSEVKDKTIEFVFKKNTQTVPLKKLLDSFSIANLKNLDLPLITYFRMTLDPGSDPHLYFNPFINYGITENPFKSSQRLYPVEMLYVLSKTYELTMEVPTGYEIEEIPKSEKIVLNDSDGSYEYMVEISGNRILIKSVMSLNKAIFEPEDYIRLKDFYATIIRKQTEMIVFKKKP